MFYTNGFLRLSSSGKWVGVLKYRDPTGQWRQVTKTFVANRDESEKMLTLWRQDMENSRSPLNIDMRLRTSIAQQRTCALSDGSPLGPSVEEAVRSTLTSQLARERIERSTYDMQIAYCERDLFPVLGSIAIGVLSPADVQKWLDALCTRTSAGSARVPYTTLSKALAASARAGIIAENPLTRVEKPPRPRPRRVYLPRDQIALLEDAIIDCWGPTHAYTCATQLALRAGLRVGECCALRWRDVAEDYSEVHIAASIGRSTRGCYLKAPKCPSSVRTIPITTALASLLEARYASSSANSRAAADYRFVCGKGDRFNSPRVLSQAFSKLCKRAGIVDCDGRRATFHVLRHTFATEAVRLGVDVRTLADLMGHARADVTLNVYAASGEEARKAASARLESAYR